MTAGPRDLGTVHRIFGALVFTVPVCLGATVPRLQAQIANRLSLGAGGASTRLVAVQAGQAGTVTGVTLFGTGRISWRMFGIEGAYRQGSLKPGTNGGTAQDIVEGRLLAAVRPLPWLQVGAGPHARAYIVPGSTERWIYFEGRVRAEGLVIGETVRTHIELWTALGAHTNVAGSSGSVRGGEAGITVKLPRSPVWGRLTYGIDRAALGSGRVETLDDVSISIGFGSP